MIFRSCKTVWLLAAATAIFAAAPALAQAPPKAEEPAAKPAAAEAESTSDNPAVAAILAAQPTTPTECAQAAKTLLDLGFPDLSKRFIKKVLDAKPDPQQLADLGEKFGSPMFLDLASHAALLPEARQLADAVVAAVAARVEDADRIAKLVGQLQDESPDARVQAMIGLQQAGAAAVGPLLAVLADPARPVEFANVRTVLAGMGPAARDPLLCILDGGDPKLTVQAIETLAEMNSPKAVVHLIWPCVSEEGDAEVRAAVCAALKRLAGGVPDRAEAVRQLSDFANRYFDRKQPIEGVEDGRVTLWQWDPSKRQCVARQGTPEEASRLLAARLAREAHALAPEDRELRLLYLAAMFDAAAYANGLDRPLDDGCPALTEAKPLGAAAIADALDYAMVHGHPAAATVAARLLGQIGTADSLLRQGDKPAPLVRAVQHPDRRLRMAALAAIVRLQPSTPFAGASYVPGALGFLAASEGQRRVLVVGPNAEQTREVTGLLSAVGLRVDATTSGRDALRMAIGSPDYEMAFIDVSIRQPDAGTLLQALRRDPRTAALPVALVARAGLGDQSERLASTDPLAKAFAKPHDVESVRWQLGQLAALAPDAVDVAMRQQQAAEALDLLADLMRSPRTFYNLRNVQEFVLAALYNPKLSQKAVAVLAGVNSAESQRALVDLASRFTQPIQVRMAAAKAFRENVQKNGILLTTGEIREQYERYNQSEKLDAATQQVLGLILDALEAPTKPIGPSEKSTETAKPQAAHNP